MTASNPQRCKARVHSQGTAVHFHQCRFKAKKDGWCNIHHPDAEQDRRNKSLAAWQERRKKDPLSLALARIEYLERQLAELDAQNARLRHK